MTPMSNADYLIRLQHADDLDALKEAKKAAGLSYQELAEKIGVNKVWLASAFEGQQFVPEEYARKLAEALGIAAEKTAFLTEHPYKGNRHVWSCIEGSYPRAGWKRHYECH